MSFREAVKRRQTAPREHQIRLAYRPGNLISNDGQRHTLALMTPQDVPALTAMYRRLSAESIWNRFCIAEYPLAVERARQFAGQAAATLTLLTRAATPIRPISGVAQLARTGPRSAEFALLIGDEFQRTGLGTALFAELLRLAAAASIDTLTASAQASNQGILAIVRRSGVPCETRTSMAETLIMLRLDQQFR